MKNANLKDVHAAPTDLESVLQLRALHKYGHVWSIEGAGSRRGNENYSLPSSFLAGVTIVDMNPDQFLEGVENSVAQSCHKRPCPNPSFKKKMDEDVEDAKDILEQFYVSERLSTTMYDSEGSYEHNFFARVWKPMLMVCSHHFAHLCPLGLNAICTFHSYLLRSLQT